ncbi:MAG: hemolysin III family protein [Lachnospiraceae bacterium]|nr:hemolysin III family protein [Lachnospiraceae bacterium]
MRSSMLQASAMQTVYLFRVKDPGSALTHFIGFIMALFAAFPLLIQGAAVHVNTVGMVSLSVFMLSMLMLYAASTIYHSFNISGKANLILKKIDHMMIFVLIAGTYTPVCVLMLKSRTGLFMLAAVWVVAAAGIVLKALWVTCPKWFSSVIYIAMGWICLFAFPQILAALNTTQFLWLLAGGIMYTVGGVIYALKLPVFNELHKNFGSHEIFHVFVMAGSFCHYVCVYLFLL